MFIIILWHLNLTSITFIYTKYNKITIAMYYNCNLNFVFINSDCVMSEYSPKYNLNLNLINLLIYVILVYLND